MKTQVGLLFALVLLTHSVGRAQTSCPEGFRYAGALSGTGSSITPFDKDVFLLLPKLATLDTSYQQTDVEATNGRSGTSSTLRAQDIPKGFFITPYGESDVAFKQGWAVSNPTLQLVKDASGKWSRYRFGMRLICKVGNKGSLEMHGECSVGVDVCYKPVQANKDVSSLLRAR